MIRNAIFLSTAISLLAASGCTTTSAPSVNTNTNSNANTAIVVDTSNTSNPIAGNVSAPPAATNSSVPGIPNAPSDVKITKEDPTRGNVKIQSAGTAAPDNSEITIALGENAIETRTFKNHPQLAKVERIQDIAN
ncbi:MAG TPA: hypothetical protein VEX64_12315, partial [Pyrinomonadaceae bacterium]|nr:hypothetical protein [Pyrinomonadaceae bacterium]